MMHTSPVPTVPTFTGGCPDPEMAENCHCPDRPDRPDQTAGHPLSLTMFFTSFSRGAKRRCNRIFSRSGRSFLAEDFYFPVWEAIPGRDGRGGRDSLEIIAYFAVPTVWAQSGQSGRGGLA